MGSTREEATVTLESAWWDAIKALGVQDLDLAQYQLNRICERYGEPHRFYHTRKHINHMLELLYELELYMPVLIMAIIFHDVIYDPKSAKNEVESAALAEDYLLDLMGAPPVYNVPLLEFLTAPVPERVFQLVLSTEKHSGGNDYGAQVLNDLDMAILGSDEEEYLDYAKAIELEYAWVPSDQYREGRSKILQGFLERDRIFVTDKMYMMFEHQARRNLLSELNRLNDRS